MNPDSQKKHPDFSLYLGERNRQGLEAEGAVSDLGETGRVLS